MEKFVYRNNTVPQTTPNKKHAWLWGPAQEQGFARVKEEWMNPAVLALYDPEAPIKISADASSHGLGAVLMQSCGEELIWKPVAYVSHAMTVTEHHYAQIEKEAPVTTWVCNQFTLYILGKEVHIKTDHKPLVPLLSTKHLDNMRPSVLRFCLQLARYDCTISHVPLNIYTQ